VRKSLGNARASVAEKVASVDELVLKPIRVIDGKIKLPGSKSLSNRILLLAALSEVCSQISFFPISTFTVQGLPICRLLARKERKKTAMFSRFQSLLSQQYACFFLPSFGEFCGT
jgi:5-enolpyruvylshikimate-3-phosphate synthase